VPLKKFIFLLALFTAALTIVLLQRPLVEREENEEEEGHADEAFEWWYAQRALPGSSIPKDGLTRAVAATRRSMLRLQKTSSGSAEPWESIGPDNIGGRVLSLAFDPDSSNIIWAGSASGGLWRSRTGGAGANAWDYINTGMAVLSVSTIAINQTNPAEMYIGTGEISGYNLGLVGTPSARTTYGLGIIKSTDRGATWHETGLTWLFNQNRSVQKIAINPKRPQTIYAATSEGAYRSYDGGATFTRILDTLMAMDLALNPADTTILYVACGQRNTSPNPGLYRSANGGNSFLRLTNGLPSQNFGRTSLSIFPADPSIVYASIANAVTHNTEGLFRTTDNGDSWETVSSSSPNYLNGQGWYNNITAVHPANASIVYAAGLDIYKSTSAGGSLSQQSYWFKGNGGIIAPGGTEGSADYAHADHHAIVFDPNDPNRMFFGCDGGIFESTDGGETFIGRNGGFVTTQFYNGFVSGVNDSLTALGGLQDNGTVKYEGNRSWNKVYGGDGGWCAIDPSDPDVMYEEYVYLGISKTTDGGMNWFSIFSSNADSSNFIAPFVLSPSQPTILYAGGKKIYKSTDGGATWNETNGGNVLNGSNVSSLAVSASGPDTLIAGTGQRAPALFALFFSTNGGTTWTASASSLPDRYPADVAFDPSNSAVAYAVFSGYGTSHVFRTTDAGSTWSDISSDLPDLPTQSVCVDPLHASHIYVGTDLGVYRTTNSGATWEPWFDGMPFAMVLDVSVSPTDRRLRAATFGNGVYQRKLDPAGPAGIAVANDRVPQSFTLEQNYPNPFNPSTVITYHLPSAVAVSLIVSDASGREIAVLVRGTKEAGTYSVSFDASRFSTGTYFYTLRAGSFAQTRKMQLIK
jgi:photosystem II stability/assembly factor-like uncharacterized protein